MKKPMPIPHGIHLGEIISECISHQDQFTKVSLSDKLGITRGALYNRLSKPEYGTAHDLLSISKILKKDLISPLVRKLDEYGIELEYISELQLKNKLLIEKNDILRSELQEAKANESTYKKIVDKLVEK